jgi:hypothetical protein
VVVGGGLIGADPGDRALDADLVGRRQDKGRDFEHFIYRYQEKENGKEKEKEKEKDKDKDKESLK